MWMSLLFIITWALSSLSGKTFASLMNRSPQSCLCMKIIILKQVHCNVCYKCATKDHFKYSRVIRAGICWTWASLTSKRATTSIVASHFPLISLHYIYSRDAHSTLHESLSSARKSAAFKLGFFAFSWHEKLTILTRRQFFRQNDSFSSQLRIQFFFMFVFTSFWYTFYHFMSIKTSRVSFHNVIMRPVTACDHTSKQVSEFLIIIRNFIRSWRNETWICNFQRSSFPFPCVCYYSFFSGSHLSGIVRRTNHTNYRGSISFCMMVFNQSNYVMWPP